MLLLYWWGEGHKQRQAMLHLIRFRYLWLQLTDLYTVEVWKWQLTEWSLIKLEVSGSTLTTVFATFIWIVFLSTLNCTYKRTKRTRKWPVWVKHWGRSSSRKPSPVVPNESSISLEGLIFTFPTYSSFSFSSNRPLSNSSRANFLCWCLHSN